MTADQLQGLRPGDEFDPLANPELANAVGNLAMYGEEDKAKAVLIDSPPDGTVTLPGGWIDDDGNLHRTALVRELNGEDEEELARPAIQRDFIRRNDTLINRCVLSIGGIAANRAMLDELTIGDRDMLLQGIRVASYGDTMRLDITCQNCRDKFQVDYTFSADVPVKKMDDQEVKIHDSDIVIRINPAQHVYDLPLRHGRSAEVALINGGMQRRVYTVENEKRSIAELNTMLLKESIQTIDGETPVMAEIRRLPSADRLRILQFLVDAQPGPQWGEVTHTCPNCDREFPLVVDVDTMFRGL